ncbi:MAG: hypothetical protein KBD46_02980 [Candidatus Levybacteria bacterium]|nr:hypothetical protein [Candidatus Levybacteria bacterium]
MGQSSTKIVDDNSHPWYVKVIAIVLILSITLLWIPFPVSETPSVVEQTVDSGVDVVDQMDGQNNFTPGATAGQNTFQKVSAAFGK